MEDLGFSPKSNVSSPTRFVLPQRRPYMIMIDEFKEYINTKLRAPTSQPLVALKRELDSFLGTDLLPPDIYDTIMEFELEQIASLYRYRFVKIVQNTPIIRRNKKYFVYTYHDSETGEDTIDANHTIYAYDVYEV
jgi:S-adenosylmethionine:diacylglycerol 3-amino-3-carboxypropyl transferase